MSSFQQITEAIEQQGRAFEAFKKANEERLDAVKSGNESKAKEMEAKMARIEKDIASASELKAMTERELNLIRERVEELEAKEKSPGKTAAQKADDEYKTAFLAWMRNR